MKKLLIVLLLAISANLLIAQQTLNNPELISGTYHGEVQLFTDYIATPNVADIFKEREDKKWTGNVHNNPKALPKGVDPALQTAYGENLLNLATLDVNMDGVTTSSLNANFAPPDPVLDVGPNHVIQMSNAPGGSSVRIFDKAGEPLTNTLTFDTNFFPAAEGAGDPIVLYDEQADRWLLTEFSSEGPNLLYVAVSTTPDPVPPATWHVYSFQAPNFPDYPKYGIWPDAYYVTTNEDGPSSVYAMPRAEMLTGATLPAIQRFTMPSLPNFGFQAATPADLDGTAPPAGSPGIIMRMADDAVQGGGAAVDQLEIWELDVDWTTPANSTLTNTLNLPTAPFSSELCGFTSFNCFPQQGTTQKLDPLRELLMYRVQYRNFGTHQTIVCNHVTDVGDFEDHGGIRWYELRKSGNANWAIHQQGTYSPDANHRWMGSIAMDGQGNIGLAYSVSSTSMFPSLRFTGRTAGDALGQMTVNETSIVAGTGASDGERWGDYASLSVDPSDDCTFWFTGEYQTANGWATRIASFQIQCTPVAPTANFTANATTICLEETTSISFKDASSQSPTSWVWTFEGGTPSTSNAENPTVSYSTPGTYDVQLIATNATGSDTEIKTDFITVQSGNCIPPPVANFTANSTSICLGETTTVSFSDASTESPTSWAWTFEGGTPAISSAQNPTVTYSAAGSYDVQLIATNGGGANTETKTDFITVTNAPCGPVCESFTSVDIPKTIPTTESSVTSSLTISLDATITDINVINLQGTHEFFDEISFSLMSPNGTNVLLVNQKCAGENPTSFNFNLDDAASNGIDVSCEYNNGGTYKPEEVLTAFNGENAMGNWVLTVTDHVFFDGGNLTNWGLEICYENTNTGCEDVLTIENPISAGTYTAANTINATGTVDNNATVLFQAGTSINLNAPFIVPAGATFTGEIAACTAALKEGSDEKIEVSSVKPRPNSPIYFAPLELHIAPNPLQYFTTISYKVPAQESVSLEITNALGQSIAQLENKIIKSPGIYRVDYQFEHQQNGIYFAVLTIGKQQITKKMLLIR